MKTIVACLLVVVSMIAAQPAKLPQQAAQQSNPPYPPSGWRPQGSAFTLPRSQPQQEYGPPPQIPTSTDDEVINSTDPPPPFKVRNQQSARQQISPYDLQPPAANAPYAPSGRRLQGSAFNFPKYQLQQAYGPPPSSYLPPQEATTTDGEIINSTDPPQFSKTSEKASSGQTTAALEEPKRVYFVVLPQSLPLVVQPQVQSQNFDYNQPSPSYLPSPQEATINDDEIRNLSNPPQQSQSNGKGSSGQTSTSAQEQKDAYFVIIPQSVVPLQAQSQNFAYAYNTGIQKNAPLVTVPQAAIVATPFKTSQIQALPFAF